MKCPRCVQMIHRGAEECPHCGFSIADADRRYGAAEIQVHRLEDTAGLMRNFERRRVEAAMNRFERSFPQLFFAVHTGRPEGRSDVRQFGFWLLNRAAFVDVGIERPNECGIVLLIDPDAKSAGISWGYALDPFLSEEDTFGLLSRGHAYWIEGRYSDGILRVLLQLSRLMKMRARQARRDPEKFERRIQPPGASRRTLRQGHRLKKGVRPA